MRISDRALRFAACCCVASTWIPLAGCASLSADKKPVVAASDWHVQQLAGSSQAIQSAPVATAGHPLGISLICDDPSKAAHGMTLALKPAGDAASFQPTAIRVGGTHYPDISLSRDAAGDVIVRDAGNDKNLTRAVASAYKAERPLTLVDADDEPLLGIRLMGSPYGSTLATFLSDCPYTAQQLPELVRISKSNILKAPKTFGFSGFRHHGANYPASAIRKGHEGNVMVQYAVSPSGEVLWPYVTQSSGYPELDRAAEKSVLDFFFKPFDQPPGTLYLKSQPITFSAPK